MRLIKRTAVIWLVMLMLLGCHAGGETIVFGSDTGTTYDALVISFELGKYEDVISAYTSNSALATYKDADKYYRYSMAQNETGKGEFEVAAYLFKGLGEFYNSSQWYSYAMGRESEKNGQYGEAIEYYTIAASLAETDSIGRMKDCIGKMDAAEQMTKYQEAITAFETASQGKNREELLHCLYLFNSMKEYGDSSEYIQKCEALIAQLERVIVLTDEEISNGRRISWTDSEPGKTYAVSVREGNSMTESKRMETAETEIELTDLIPGTTYTVTVMDADQQEVFSSCTIFTPAAEHMARDDLKFKRISLAGVEKAFLEISGESFEALYREKPSLFVTPEEASIDSQLLEKNAYCFITSMEYFGEGSVTISVMSVLRSENSGVRKTEEKELQADSADSKFFMITRELNSLLQQFTDSFYDLKTDSYRYELYIDGKLCCEYAFTIEGR